MNYNDYITEYKGVPIYKNTGVREDGEVIWAFYYADGFPHKAGRLTISRISSQSLAGIKRLITKHTRQ